MATLLSLDDLLLCKILRILLRSNVPGGLGGAALVCGRDAFALALGCRRLLDLFIGCSLRSIEYDFKFLPDNCHRDLQNPAHIASLLALSRKRLESFSLLDSTSPRLWRDMAGIPAIDMDEEDTAFVLKTASQLCPRLSSVTIHFPEPTDILLSSGRTMLSSGRTIINLEFWSFLETFGPALTDISLLGTDLAIVGMLSVAPIAPKSLALLDLPPFAVDDVFSLIISLGQSVERLELGWSHSTFSHPSVVYDLLLKRLPPSLKSLKLSGGYWSVPSERPQLLHLQKLSPNLEELVLCQLSLEKSDAVNWHAGGPARISLQNCRLMQDGSTVSGVSHMTGLWGVLGERLFELAGVRNSDLSDCRREGCPPLGTCCPRLTSIEVPGLQGDADAAFSDVVALCNKLGPSLKKVDFRLHEILAASTLVRALQPCIEMEELYLCIHDIDSFLGGNENPIGPALRGMSRLRVLRIHPYEFFDEGQTEATNPKFIEDLARFNRRLVELELPMTHILLPPTDQLSIARGRCRELLAAIDRLERSAPKVHVIEYRSFVQSHMDKLW